MVLEPFHIIWDGLAEIRLAADRLDERHWHRPEHHTGEASRLSDSYPGPDLRKRRAHVRPDHISGLWGGKYEPIIGLFLLARAEEHDLFRDRAVLGALQRQESRGSSWQLSSILEVAGGARDVIFAFWLPAEELHNFVHLQLALQCQSLQRPRRGRRSTDQISLQLNDPLQLLLHAGLTTRALVGDHRRLLLQIRQMVKVERVSVEHARVYLVLENLAEEVTDGAAGLAALWHSLDHQGESRLAGLWTEFAANSGREMSLAHHAEVVPLSPHQPHEHEGVDV
mmetsp:Transcript_130094/g.328327  ORF Transcript_130094/g.328327 Transcript_130094/m.328327 type:complete len:282 (+) Transcript_130094:441-1286(+)